MTYHNCKEVTTSGVRATNVAEDVAEVICRFLDSNEVNERIVNTPDSPLSKKLEVILSRIDAIAPGSAEYLTYIRDYLTGLEESYF